MKGLRGIWIVALVAVLMLVSFGTVFAKGPPASPPGNGGPKSQGEKQGFFGNVTTVIDGNVTIKTAQGLVTLTSPADFQYKIPREIGKWQSGNLSALGDLAGSRVVILAGNVSGTWQILKLMVLPVPGTQPLHAHQVGNVTASPPANGTSGNITIEDVHGVLHKFAVIGNDSAIDNQTIYRPIGVQVGNITVGSFVTVVTTGNQDSVELPVAKAIVLHAGTPVAWPKPTY